MKNRTLLKRNIIFVALNFAMCILLAQAPQKMSYQAVIRNGSNQLVTNAPVGMRISIVQSTIFGPSVYVETQTPTTNINGLVSTEIGSGTVILGNFSTIDWSAGPYFIKTETDPSGGSNYSITGTSQLMSVPFALYAKKAENGFSGNYNDLTNTPSNVSSFINDAGYITAEVDGSVTNELQTISRSGNTVTLSNGGGSFTDSVHTYTGGIGISVVGNSIETNPSNLSVHYLFSPITVSSGPGGTDVPWVTGTSAPPSVIDSANYAANFNDPEVTIKTAGTYLISYNLTLENATVGTIGNSASVWLQIFMSANYVNLNGTNSAVYTGTTPGAAATASINTVYDFMAGDKIKLNARQITGDGTMELVPHAGRILLTRIK